QLVRPDARPRAVALGDVAQPRHDPVEHLGGHPLGDLVAGAGGCPHPQGQPPPDPPRRQPAAPPGRRRPAPGLHGLPPLPTPAPPAFGAAARGRPRNRRPSVSHSSSTTSRASKASTPHQPPPSRNLRAPSGSASLSHCGGLPRSMSGSGPGVLGRRARGLLI